VLKDLEKESLEKEMRGKPAPLDFKTFAKRGRREVGSSAVKRSLVF